MAPTMKMDHETSYAALVVDDSPIIRRVLIRILAEYSITCEEAKTGAEAIEKFQQGLAGEHPYDIVVLDVHLPEMGGLAVLNRLREAERLQPGSSRVHIFMLTADDSEEIVKSAVSHGADAYFLKPFDRASLGAHLERVVGRQRTSEMGLQE